MAHLSYNLNEAANQVRALNVLVGFIENHKLIEFATFISGLGKELQEYDK
jgi:hypothetical protein